MIVYHRTTAATARELSRALGIPRSRTGDSLNPILIRWGSSMRGIDTDNTINPLGAIVNTTHGLNMLRTLDEHGVRVPKYGVSGTPESFPIYLRRINHVGGSDIILVDEDVVNDVGVVELLRQTSRRFFTERVDVDKEYRVHVFDDKVLRAFIKVPREEQCNHLIRSSRFGWGYRSITTPGPRMVEVSIESVRALGLTFGGVDLVFTTDKKYVVIEVNTGPSLNSNTLPLYVNEFRKWFSERGVTCLSDSQI